MWQTDVALALVESRYVVSSLSDSCVALSRDASTVEYLVLIFEVTRPVRQTDQ